MENASGFTLAMQEQIHAQRQESTQNIFIVVHALAFHSHENVMEFCPKPAKIFEISLL